MVRPVEIDDEPFYPSTPEAPSLPPGLWPDLMRGPKRTWEEIIAGGKQLFQPVKPRTFREELWEGIERVMGLGRIIGAPTTAFIYEPVKEFVSETVPAEAARLSGKPKVSAPILGEIAGLGASFLTPTQLLNWPSTLLRAIPKTGRVIAKLGEKEKLVRKIMAERGLREEEARQLLSELGEFQGAAPGLAQRTVQAEEATRLAQAEAEQQQRTALGAETIRRTQQKELQRIKNQPAPRLPQAEEEAVIQARQKFREAIRSPKPPKLPELEPQTAQAMQEAERFPLRLKPTPVKEIGERYSGTFDNPGLFRTAAKGIQENLSIRLKTILGAEDRPVNSLEPIRNAANAILPPSRVSRLGYRSQGIAEGILTNLERLPGNEIEKAELVTEEFDKALRALPRGTPISFLDVMDLSKYKTTAEAFRVYQERIIAGALPTLKTVHGERIIIRALKRGAEKSGQGVLRQQLQTLENGYTQVINDTLGQQGASQLARWDRDYAYGVTNLFGYKSLPYNLSKDKAEDFVVSLFRKTGKQQEERVVRVMELLGPEQRLAFKDAFLQTVTNRSQKAQMPFDPVAWGKEYLLYREGIKNALFAPEYREDLNRIARIFRQTPLRQAEAETVRAARITQARQEAEDAIETLRAARKTRQAEVETRRAEIAQAGRQYQARTTESQEAQRIAKEGKEVLGVTKTKAQQTEKLLSQLRSEAQELEREIRRTNTIPSEAERQALERLKEITAPGKFEKFLRAEELYAGRRAAFGIGAMVLGAPFGATLALEGGAIVLGTGALQTLLTSDRGARIVRLLAEQRPGSERAKRLAIIASQLLNEANPETERLTFLPPNFGQPMQTPKIGFEANQ